MGVLQTTIKLNDQFSDKLSKINKSIQNTTNAMNRLNNVRVSGGNVNKSLSRQISQNDTILGQMRQWAANLRNVLTLYYGIRGAVQGVNRSLQLSDRMTMNTARLGLMADSKNPVGALETKSFAAAMRARTDYLDFNKAVTKLGILAGDKFANQDSIIRFTELMQKQFAVGGADASERNAAMLQLTQAIASNRLQGDELRSIRENAPLLVKAIQDSLGVSEAKFKDMAKAGEITADVIIKAMAKSDSEVETMFNKLPLTWEHVATRFRNVSYLAFDPIHKQFERLFNDQRFLKFMASLQNAMIVVGNITGLVLKKMIDGVNALNDFFERHATLLNFIKNAFIVFGVIAVGVLAKMAWGLLTNLILLPIVNFQANLLAVNMTRVAMGLTAYTSAQYAANGAMAIFQALAGNVFVWIGLIVLIIIAVVKAINHFCGTTYSAVGVIAGAVAWLATVIWDIVVGIVWGIAKALDNIVNFVINAAEIVYNSFSGGFTDWMSGVANAFGHLISWVLGKIKPLVELWDKFKGTNYAASLTTTQSKLTNFGKTSSYKKFDRVNMSGWVAQGFANPNKSYSKAYKWGANLENKIGDLSKLELDISKTELEALNGIKNGVGDLSDNLGDIGGNTGNTAKNTKDIANNTGSKDYSYLRDWYYQRGLGNSIGYTIKIEQNNRNNIASGVDVNKFMNMVRDEIVNALVSGKERVGEV